PIILGLIGQKGRSLRRSSRRLAAAAEARGALARPLGQEHAARRRSPLTMAMSLPEVDRFERLLLRRGVGALEADRDRCAGCAAARAARAPGTIRPLHWRSPWTP